MNLREAIGEYAVRYAQCQEVIGWEGEGAERIRRQFGESVDRLCCVVKVAEAAVAYMEHQANPPEGGLTDTLAYFHKLAELGKAFMEARRKAEEACNSLAGEGET